ncbi:exopolysaccharide Pel transporter PelG [Sphingomonas adhaesiva]|uniref:exopolysaccharide Pel transporter PelG n=1 Tax=Sphingomonas adhaesiva TaxID=28212 RepID=UPI002FF5CF9D
MAGIGFQLARMARDGGIGGIAGAALHGSLVSAGPWLITAGAMEVLEQWTAARLDLADAHRVQTLLVYAFSLSALVAAPVGMLATRLVADRLFARDAGGVPGVVVAALTIGGALGLAAGALLFAFATPLPLVEVLIAAIAVAWLAQIWVAAPLLTALRRYRAVPAAYAIGIAGVVVALTLWPSPDARAVLAIVTAGFGATLASIVTILRGHFAARAVLPASAAMPARRILLVAGSGLAGVAAVWVDKWLLWLGPSSAATLGTLRLNPINDSGSFLGLLAIVPGLTLLLIVTETRFDRAFGALLARCTGTSTLERIQEAHRDVGHTLLDGLRLLVLAQALVAALAWVLAVPLFEAIGADMRAIFAFRHSAVGTVFHLVTIATTVALAYYDLFGRILLTWTAFVAAAAIATLVQWPLGLAGFGWGYMAGAVVGATVGVALAAEATVHLVYLLFVGNNPAVVGEQGRIL